MPWDPTGGTRQFSQQHGFLTGMILITIGVAGMWGAISGNLAGMLAALFNPSDLYDVNTGGNAEGTLGQILHGQLPSAPGGGWDPLNWIYPNPSNPLGGIGGSIGGAATGGLF